MSSYSKLTIFEPVSAFTEEEKRSWKKGGFHIDSFEKGGRKYIAPENGRIVACQTMISVATRILCDENCLPEKQGEWELNLKEAERELSELESKFKRYNLWGRWQVPIEWFALFEDRERNLNFIEGFGYSIGYETALETAQERLDRVINILEEVNFSKGLSIRLVELRDFFEPFDPESCLILSYSEVNRMFNDTELKEDRSAQDFSDGLSALEKGEREEAKRYFGLLSKRWEQAVKKGNNALDLVMKEFRKIEDGDLIDE